MLLRFNMRPAALPRFSGVLAVLAAASFAHADWIETPDRKQLEGRILAVAADGVRLATADACVPWSEVRRVVFCRPSVHAAESRLLLRDGSCVCGVARHLTKQRIVFRSVSAGELDLAMDQVAALQFVDGPAIAAVRNASVTNVVALLRSGLARAGTLVFASAHNILLKTPDDMEKIAIENLSGLVFNPLPLAGAAGIALRNGDLFCAPPQWTANGLKTNVGGVDVAIPFEALAEIRR